jgi:hypothetical protein
VMCTGVPSRGGRPPRGRRRARRVRRGPGRRRRAVRGRRLRLETLDPAGPELVPPRCQAMCLDAQLPTHLVQALATQQPHHRIGLALRRPSNLTRVLSLRHADPPDLHPGLHSRISKETGGGGNSTRRLSSASSSRGALPRRPVGGWPRRCSSAGPLAPRLGRPDGPRRRLLHLPGRATLPRCEPAPQAVRVAPAGRSALHGDRADVTQPGCCGEVSALVPVEVKGPPSDPSAGGVSVPGGQFERVNRRSGSEHHKP